jgi:hypothetical protein
MKVMFQKTAAPVPKKKAPHWGAGPSKSPFGEVLKRGGQIAELMVPERG